MRRKKSGGKIIAVPAPPRQQICVPTATGQLICLPANGTVTAVPQVQQQPRAFLA